MTRELGDAVSTFRVAVMPSVWGMRMFMRMISGCPSAARVTICSPYPKRNSAGRGRRVGCGGHQRPRYVACNDLPPGDLALRPGSRLPRS